MRNRLLFLGPLFFVNLAVFWAPGCANASSGGFEADDDAGGAQWNRGATDASTSSRDASTSTTDDGGSDAATISIVDSGSAEITDGGASIDSGSAIDSGTTTDAGSATTTSTDPFDPAACATPALTFEQGVAKLGAGVSSVTLGSYELMQRTRTCDAVTGCSAWGPASQAYAAPAEGNLTGGFALDGNLVLDTEGTHLGFRWNDASQCSFCGPSLQFVSNETSGTMTYDTGGLGYSYTVLYNFLIPPSPQSEYLHASFVVVASPGCAQTISSENGTDGPNTVQWAAIVHY